MAGLRVDVTGALRFRSGMPQLIQRALSEGLTVGSKVTMISSNPRIRLLLGALLLLMGAGVVAFSSRVLATFLLDIVVQSLVSDSGEAMEPYDFMWGTMHWGNSAADFTMLCAGIVVLALGQILVVPPVVHRLKSTASGTGSMLPKMVMVGASVLMFLAAGIFLLIPFITKSAIGFIALAGAVDPVSFAEDLPVLTSRMFMVCLILSQVLIVLAALSVLQQRTGEIPCRCSILAYGVGGCSVLFAILISTIRLGPVRALSELIGLGSQADPGLPHFGTIKTCTKQLFELKGPNGPQENS